MPVDNDLTPAEAYQREADSARARLGVAEGRGHHPEYLEGLRARVARFDRLAETARGWAEAAVPVSV